MQNISIFCLHDPMRPSVHAMFSHLGTWESTETCKTCNQADHRLVEPLLVEWDPGTDQIGDFSWCGYTCIVTDRVRAFMEENGYDVNFFTGIEYQKFKRVERLGGRHKRVKFPYEGPHLNWAEAAKHLQIDPMRSGLENAPDCPACGRSRIKFSRENLFIPKDKWNGEKIFVIEQFRSSVCKFITEGALRELEQQGFTNFVADPAGVIGE